MKCPECQFENEPDAKFCSQCGYKLELICPECGKINRSSSKFCNQCGNDLPGSAVKKKPQKIDSERKHVTILFSDLSGYTSMTERLDPEEVKEIMSRIFGEIAQVVAKYEGFIERFIGDAVMALFGVPRVHEDDAVRAIRAAREIHAVVEKMSPGLEKKVGRPLAMHSGISTGLVVTGEVNLEKGTHGVTGDSINLASRLEGLARPGEIIVGRETYRQAEGYFIFERMEPIKIRGKLEPVKTYRVIAPSTRKTRFEISAERGLTPLVGRMGKLEQLLKAFELCKEGKGQAFSIVSEAGLGKSRLLYEFRKATGKEQITFLEGKCLSYSRGTSYKPVIDILKSNFDIKENDGDSEIRQKVISILEALDVDVLKTLPYLLELLSVRDSGIDQISMSPEAKKEEIIQALKRITLKVAEIRPLVLVVEDLHWVDDSSHDVFKEILDSISNRTVFLLFSYRPEFVPVWGVKPYLNHINLNRLSKPDSLSIVAHLLGTEDMEKDLEDMILEKTGGNPFFIEEFIKSYKDLGMIEKKDKYRLVENDQDFSIPSTIQDVILARIDTLPVGAKETLQVASVIEREFSYELLSRVMGSSERLLQAHLSALSDAELLYERGFYPRTSYIFKHTLTRDVVYDSILIKRRKQLHKKIGEAIEELYTENISEYYGVLAEHFLESENYEKAAMYSKFSGRKAEKTGALKEAISYALKRISSLEKLPRTESLENQIVHLRTILGIFMIEMNYFQRARDIVAPILRLGLNSDNKKRRSQLLMIIGSYEYVVEENFPEAFKHLEEALEISKEIDEKAPLSSVSYWIGCAYHLNAELDKASIHMKRAVKIVSAGKIQWREATIKSLLSHMVYYHQGKVELAYETSHEALRIADRSGDLYSQTFAYCCHGISCFAKGSYQEAERLLSKGTEFSERLDHSWWKPWSKHFLGEFYYEMGQYQKARFYYDEAVSIFDSHGYWPSNAITSKMGLARAKSAMNGKGMDLDSLSVYISEAKAKLYEGWILRYMSEILLNAGEGLISEAEHWIKKSVAANEKNGTLFELGRAYLFYAEIKNRKKDQAGAHRCMKRAMEIFKECGAEGWIQKYEKEH